MVCEIVPNGDKRFYSSTFVYQFGAESCTAVVIGIKRNFQMSNLQNIMAVNRQLYTN